MALAVGRSALALLLDLLEMPDAVLSGSVMQDHYTKDGQQLLAAGLLRADGHDPIDGASDEHDDAPVSLIWNPDTQRFGYFDASAGWVAVEHDRVARFRVETTLLLATMMNKVADHVRRPAIVLIEDHLWDLGEHRLPHRTHRVPVWFARRLHDAGTWKKVKDTARARAHPRQRLILTSTCRGRLPEDTLLRHKVVPLDELIGGDGTLLLDPELVAARLDSLAPQPNGPLVVTGDGREVRLNGEVFRFPRGQKSRQIIVLLYERYQQGQLWVPSAEIVSELDLAPRTRIRDIFKPRKGAKGAWNRLLTERNGMCGFCL